MSWKELLVMPFVVISVAAVAGFGMLAYRIGGTWDQRNTDMLTSGAVLICLAGVMLFFGIVGILIGVPVFLRVMDSRNDARNMAMDARIASAAFNEQRRLERMDERWARAGRPAINADFEVLPQDARPLLPAPGAPTQPFGMPGGFGGVPFDGLDDDPKFSAEGW